jgi:hypothetical protein
MNSGAAWALKVPLVSFRDPIPRDKWRTAAIFFAIMAAIGWGLFFWEAVTN